MNEIEFKLNQLADNELTDSEQIEVYKTLVEDANLRQAYTELLKLKNEIAEYYHDQKHEIKLPAFNNPVQVKPRLNLYKIGLTISSAAAIVLGMLLWSSSINNASLEYKNRSLMETVSDYQSSKETLTINNSSSHENTLNNRIRLKKHVNRIDAIVKSNKTFNANSTNPTILFVANDPFEDVHTVKLTKNDYLTAKIVGN